MKLLFPSHLEPFPKYLHFRVPTSRSHILGRLQAWDTGMGSYGTGQKFLRVSSASAASSFRCHSEEATKAGSETWGSCKAKTIRKEHQKYTSLPNGTNTHPTSYFTHLQLCHPPYYNAFFSSRPLNLVPVRFLKPSPSPAPVAAVDESQGWHSGEASDLRFWK